MRADEHRAALGFLTVDATDALAEDGVCVLDPASTLVTRSAVIEPGVVLYPTVVIDGDQESEIRVGSDCVMYPNTVLEARAGGRIEIGADVELGPGGVLVRVGAGERTTLEAEVRLNGGCELTGSCHLGRGAQILGAISARSVRLAGGRGGHRWPEPDQRGAVLKGAGLAEGIDLKMGEVKSRRAMFADAPTERQATYHWPR